MEKIQLMLKRSKWKNSAKSNENGFRLKISVRSGKSVLIFHS